MQSVLGRLTRSRRHREISHAAQGTRRILWKPLGPTMALVPEITPVRLRTAVMLEPVRPEIVVPALGRARSQAAVT